jgi:uncharacterized membrane protein (UPF0136 family)
LTDVLDFESRNVPASVALAGMIGLGKAGFEILFGVLGIAVASSLDDSFGTGALIFGIVYAIASLLLLRGSRIGYYLTVVLSMLGLVAAVVYMFSSEGTVFGGTLLIALLNALVLYLLLVRQGARDFFGRGVGAGP